MKIKHLLLIPLIGATTIAARADNSQPLPQINISDSAEIRVVPDEVMLSTAVETRAETLEAARLENDQKVTACLAFLKEQKLKDKEFKTDQISIEPIYNNRNMDNLSYVKPIGYKVRKNIEVRLSDVGSFQNILTGLLTNGVNFVNNVDFRSTELRRHRDHARQMAAQAAREKAEALTKELGAKLGKVYNINGNDNGGIYLGRFNAGFNNYVQNVGSVSSASGLNDNATDTFAIGMISVTASVNVTFLIE